MPIEEKCVVCDEEVIFIEGPVEGLLTCPICGQLRLTLKEVPNEIQRTQTTNSHD